MNSQQLFSSSFFWQRFKEAGRNIAYFNKIFHARAKALWWDGAFKSPNPHLLDMRPSEQKVTILHLQLEHFNLDRGNKTKMFKAYVYKSINEIEEKKFKNFVFCRSNCV